MQNSEAVLWSGRSTDVDQATLLIALLRAAGVPARYVQGSFQIPYADIINWMEAKEITIAQYLLSYVGAAQDLVGKFSVYQFWVEAYYDPGPVNVVMAPAIKQRVYQPGMQPTLPAFDWSKFLSTVNPQLATESYVAQVLAALRQSNPNAA